MREADAVLICLSSVAVSTRSYLHKEIALALNAAQEQPEGTIYVIPLRLDDCSVPSRLRHWQWIDLFDRKGYRRLLSSLQERARMLAQVRA